MTTTNFIDKAMQKAADHQVRDAQERKFSVPMRDWGKDHWSLLGYLEYRCVNHKGFVQFNQMQCNKNRHPQYLGISPHGSELDGSKYGIRLAGKRQLPGPDYDEWDCIEDLMAEGLIRDIGFTMTPQFQITDKGWEIVKQVMKFKGEGHHFYQMSYLLGLRTEADDEREQDAYAPVQETKKRRWPWSRGGRAQGRDAEGSGPSADGG